MSSRGINFKFLGAGLVAAAAWPAYLLTIRRWHERWGATDEEVGRPMPGDVIVAHPWDVTTRAISIKAEPEHIWPWLAQMGYQRGGMYSYDWIDQLIGVLDQPSSERVLPEFQVLRPGDVIPIGYGPDWPIEAVEPQRSLVLNIEQPGIHISWSFLLDPTDGVYTRLILRIRIQLRPLAHVLSYFPISDFGQFLMTRRMLLGIKQRAESLAKS
jgi:hypothetical protein